MEKLRIYAEVSFLDSFFKSINKELDRQLQRKMLELIALLESRVILHLDCTYEEFLHKSEESADYRILRDKSQRSQLDLNFVDEIDPDKIRFSGHDLLLLNCSEEQKIELEEKYEIIVCNLQSFKTTLNELFIHRINPLEKGTSNSNLYKEISEGLPDSQSLIINDPFILTDPYKREGIVNWCIHLPSKMTANLIILSKKVPEAKITEHMKKLERDIKDLCSKEINISIVKNSIHHRYLLTDHYFIHSNQSLHYFKNGKCEFTDTATVKTKFLPKPDHKSLSGFEEYISLKNELRQKYKEATRASERVKCILN